MVDPANQFEVQAIQNYTYDSVSRAVKITDTPFIEAFAYNESGMIEYSGKASPGSSKGATLWQIKKYVYSGTNVVDILFADGNTNFDNEWDERENLEYS